MLFLEYLYNTSKESLFQYFKNIEMHKKCGYFSIIPLLKLYKTISSKAQVSFPFIYLRYILFLILSKVYRHVFI